MKKAYFARPINIYGSKQEARDIELIESLGFSVVDITSQEIQDRYKEQGMQLFLDIVKGCDSLFFRCLPDMGIPAGVAKEVLEAVNSGIPVFEIPSSLTRRTLSVDETREYLQQVGAR